MILGSEPPARGVESYTGGLRPSQEGLQWTTSSTNRASSPHWAAHPCQRASDLIPARTEEQIRNKQEASQGVAAGKQGQEHERAEEDSVGFPDEEVAGEQQYLPGSHHGDVDPNPFITAREIDPGSHALAHEEGLGVRENTAESLESIQLPPEPPDEHLRLETLQSLGLHRSHFSRDPMLVSMCEMISELMDVPIVGISIIQEKQLVMCASVGLPDGTSIERHKAACSWTLLPKSPEVMVVEDMLEDSRFASLDYVTGALGVRFYAGAPLLATNGTRVGSVCVLDTKPRKMNAENYNMLSNFSEIAMQRLEERVGYMSLGSNKAIPRLSTDIVEPFVLCDVSGKRWWSLLYCNSAFSKMTGISNRGSMTGESNLWKYFQPAGDSIKSKAQESMQEDIRQDRDFKIVVQSCDSARDDIYEMHFRPATKSNLSPYATLISVPDFVPAADGDDANGYYFAIARKLDSLSEEHALDSDGSQGSLNGSRRKMSVPQRTFMSASSLRDAEEGLQQGADVGMHDVTMGVLCSSSPGGLVYRARWRHRSVSVRVIELKESTCIRDERFGDALVPLEAALSINLEHPHIIRTIKVVLEGRPVAREDQDKMVLAWMVREWCGRGKLTDAVHCGWLRVPSGKPNIAVVVAVAQEIAQAMLHLHAEGIIHGDLCMDSILLADDPEPSASKVKDFICKLTEFGHSLKSRVPVKTTSPGTATHAAPELLNKAEMSPQSDVYAFGMMLWEIYCSEAVWPTLNISQLQRRVVAAKEKPPLPEDVPLSIKDLIYACLENQPADRPSFEEILERLRLIAQEQAAGKLITALMLEQPADTKHRLFWKSSKDKGTIFKKLLKKSK